MRYLMMLSAKMFYFCSLLAIIQWTVADICPDKTQCDNDSTYCKSSVGGYFCCPFKDAYCCSDGLTCGTSSSLCKKTENYQNYSSASLLNKAMQLQFKADKVSTICPGGKYSCPGYQTCCPLSYYYTCCPFQSAVCCADGVHCCPIHTVCDLVHNVCTGADFSPPKKDIAIPHSLQKIKVQEDDQICPDGTTCDKGTCCKISSTNYGCCPYPQATCCSDRRHCCPSGMKCNLQNQTCNAESVSLPFHKQAEVTGKLKQNYCPDGKTACPDKTTCCVLQDGSWGCCLYENATCCDDHIHCCPSGQTCNVEAGACENGLRTMPMLKKMKAFHIKKPFV